ERKIGYYLEVKEWPILMQINNSPNNAVISKGLFGEFSVADNNPVNVYWLLNLLQQQIC
ncbi:7999_t:CDS:2, partial [Ambispora leptoticha]